MKLIHPSSLWYLCLACLRLRHLLLGVEMGLPSAVCSMCSCLEISVIELQLFSGYTCEYPRRYTCHLCLFSLVQRILRGRTDRHQIWLCWIQGPKNHSAPKNHLQTSASCSHQCSLFTCCYPTTQPVFTKHPLTHSLANLFLRYQERSLLLITTYF